MSQKKENSSLTAPKDWDSATQYIPKLAEPPLPEDQVPPAMEELNVTDHVDKFKKIERIFADPPQMNQVISLHSFIPSKGATPDEDGVFGMVKIRGVYATKEEANQRAEALIRSVDSYHKIFHAFVGRPFPITLSSKFSAETTVIDLRKKTETVISEDILAQKAAEKAEMDDMHNREKALLEESKKAKAGEPTTDPFDDYITMHVKKAQNIWIYLETQRKMEIMKQNIIDTRAALVDFDENEPEFRDRYKAKYMDARRASGLKEDDESFIKYLGEDAAEELGF
jgi:hypothetical protein